MVDAENLVSTLPEHALSPALASVIAKIIIAGLLAGNYYKP
jgi:hypothetical protein